MVPLFNRNQGQVAAAQAERSGAEARREAADTGRTRGGRRRTGARRASAASGRAVRPAGRGHSLDRISTSSAQTFDLGRATVFDVLTEQRRYLDFEHAYTTALREAWEARAASEARAGRNEMNSAITRVTCGGRC